MIGLCLRDVVRGEDISLSEEASLKEAVSKMETNGKGAVVVLRNSMPIGIITERDIVELLVKKVDLQSPIIQYVKKDLITTQHTKAVGYALNLMLTHNIRRIVVTDKSGEFCGLITQQDMIRHLEDDFYRSTLKIWHIIGENHPLIYCGSEDTLSTAMQKMYKNQISAIPVIVDSRPEGIITERDILRVVKEDYPLSAPVSGCMSRPVITAGLDDTVTFVVNLMNSHNIRRVVVIDREGKAIGVLTHRDLLRNLDCGYTEFVERKLKHTKDILNFLPEMVLEVIDADEEQKIIWANEKALKRFGAEIINASITDLITPDKWSDLYNTLCKVGKVENLKVKHDEYIYEISGFFLKPEADLCAGKIHFIVRDITDEVKLYTTDPLTGLYNRRFFNEFLHKEIESCKRYGRRLSIAILDIDNFKYLNDTYGHVTGDNVLKSLAMTMLKNVRNADTVSRYGGEEFIIVMPETERGTAATVIDRLRERVSRERVATVGSGSISITISAGVASYPEDADSPIDIMIVADDRLYKAKREGKNRVVYS